MSSRPLVILISQSGETADTLAAARAAKQQGCHTVAICNVPGSRITREVDGVIITKSGQEIGVAATKTFLTHRCRHFTHLLCILLSNQAH